MSPVIQFPETAIVEWQTVADAAEAEDRLRKKIRHDTEVEHKVNGLRVQHEAKALFQAELDADATPVLEMMTLQNYQSNPAAAPADMIDGVMKRDGLCLVIGPSGSGKSTLALQMLHSLMSGDDWLGQSAQQISGSVGILSYDMDASMVLDWMSGFPNIDPNKVSVVNAYKRGNPLGVPAFRKQIATAWKQMGVEVVMLDSFSASFFGADQNDAAATQHHYRDLKLFALTEVGAKALIVIAHTAPSSPDKARGSTVHHDVADSIISVVPDAHGIRSVDMVKYRAARQQKQMAKVMISAPDDVTHLVSLDTGSMTLNGLSLPAGAAAEAFEALPEAHEQPDTDSGSEEDEL